MIDQRKVTPQDNEQVRVKAKVMTVCDTLWPDREFLKGLQSKLNDEEEKCELLSKESLIFYYDDVIGDRVRELSIWNHNLLIF